MPKHQLTSESGLFACTVCERTWTKQPSSSCPGVKIYSWGAWGEDLLTKKQMNDAGFQTGMKLPPPAGAVSRDESPGGWMWLYRRDQGVPKKAISEAQKAALAKAAEKSRIGWTCQRCGYRLRYYQAGGGLCKDCQILDMIERDHAEETEWARKVLAEGTALILDTETTGLDAGYNEVIQIAVIDVTGQALLNTFVQAQHPERMFDIGGRGLCAHDVHKISPEMLEGAPTFPEIYPKLLEIIAGRQVIVYNVDFDAGMLAGMCRRYKLPPINTDEWLCAMNAYSAWCGDWSDYWGNYRWQSLDGGHSAVEDCRAVIEVLKRMSDS